MLAEKQVAYDAHRPAVDLVCPELPQIGYGVNLSFLLL